ncbi:MULTISPECIES: hypothetical protein [Methanocalculus]|uniref:hypothetical protein n=1 Tax=Methanocalculus TaxID=71151 RepID=UPI0020A1E300|nr:MULTISPECIES: hypothetical protein [unclassified Methanocalculus]MCP1661647.1 hypothetical protein [Methanocalculus sp. AMF5]
METIIEKRPDNMVMRYHDTLDEVYVTIIPYTSTTTPTSTNGMVNDERRYCLVIEVGKMQN